MTLVATRDDLVRGVCPTVSAPFATGDGGLIRVRLPGGHLSIEGLRGLAAAADRTGHDLELTSRANVQLRGFDDATLARATVILTAAGLVASAPLDDGRRNVLASPTAAADVGNLVTRIADLLAISTPAHVSPKLGVVVDGGERCSVGDRRDHIALQAVAETGGLRGWAVTIDGAPRDRNLATAVPCDAAIPAIERILDLFATTRATSGAALLAALGVSAIGAAMPDAFPVAAAPRAQPTTSPIGVVSQMGAVVTIGAAPVLGRLSSATARTIADLLDSISPVQLRVTPWRSVVVDIPIDAVDAVLAGFADLGWATTADDPAVHVVACAGSIGCHAGVTDVQALGRSLVGAGRAGSTLRTPIHLTGCEKRCASRDDSVWTVLGLDADTVRVVEPGGWPDLSRGPVLSVAAATEHLGG